MSETTETAPQGGGAAAPEPAVTTDETTAPVDTGAATETEQPEHKPAGDEGDPAAKRIARLTARYAQTARERDELAGRIAQLEARQREGGAQPDADTEALINARAEQLMAERSTKQRIEAFHEAGREAFPDWQEKCQGLMAMGADAQMSQLLVEMKDGPRIAAALHDDPDALEAIARLSTPTARAVALGQFAAKVEARPARPARTVSQAPPPIRPVQGRVQAEFNPYTAGNTADGNQALTDYFMREARKARGLPG
jgi:hypothetical protein